MTMKSNSTTTRTVKVVTETTDQTGRSTGSMVYLVMPLLMLALRRRAILFYYNIIYAFKNKAYYCWLFKYL